MGDSIIKVQQIVCQEKNAVLEIIYAEIANAMLNLCRGRCSNCVRQSAYDRREELRNGFLPALLKEAVRSSVICRLRYCGCL